MNDPTALSLEYRDPLIGRVLHERYRVVRLIGRGGMGVVYLAEHVVILRKFAIKVLHSQLTATEELVHRFHREARAATAAGDEHIVDVTDMGRLADGTIYMVMEYLDGPDLAALVEKEGPLDVRRTIDIGLQICDALQSVHAAGIVHRDLKPENVVLIDRPQRNDFVKLLDFGICKVMNEQPLTATGIALGTPQFMAPEQLEARREVDQRADIYAVGAMLFFAMSGRNPFISESLPQLLVSIWSDSPPKLREVCPEAPAALERTIARALEKHPNRRFWDARELAAELSEIAASLGFASHVREPSRRSQSGSCTQPRSSTQSIITQSSEISAVRPAGARRGWRALLTGAGALLAACVFAGWLYLLASSLTAPIPLGPKHVAPRTTAAQVATNPPKRVRTAAEQDDIAPRDKLTEPIELAGPKALSESNEVAGPNAAPFQRPGRASRRRPAAETHRDVPAAPPRVESATEPVAGDPPASAEPARAPAPLWVPTPAQLKPVF